MISQSSVFCCVAKSRRTVVGGCVQLIKLSVQNYVFHLEFCCTVIKLMAVDVRTLTG